MIDLKGLEVRYLKQVSHDEYSAECPRCGGSVHRGGELPDRFRIFLHSKTTGDLLGWCRQCGYVWTPKGTKLDPIRQQAWVEERKSLEQEKLIRIKHTIELLNREKIWLKYHDNLTPEIRKYFYKRHIDDFWIDYWQLGYNPKKIIWTGTEEYVTPAITIPVIEPVSQEVLTIRNRLLSPADPADKYRPETSGLPSSLYYTDYDNPISKKALIVEGEFKAMTTCIELDTPDISVVGIAGKTPNIDIFAPLASCQTVYLLLDPDAYVCSGKEQIPPIRRLINHFQDRARVISLPYKVDDMIIDGSLRKEDLQILISTARKAETSKTALKQPLRR